MLQMVAIIVSIITLVFAEPNSQTSHLMQMSNDEFLPRKEALSNKIVCKKFCCHKSSISHYRGGEGREKKRMYTSPKLIASKITNPGGQLY